MQNDHILMMSRYPVTRVWSLHCVERPTSIGCVHGMQGLKSTTLVLLKIRVLWDITSCWLVNSYRYVSCSWRFRPRLGIFDNS